jgi:hypothetical protein
MSFLEIFQPGLRHLREERERQRLIVPRPPAAGPGGLGIDLDAGTAMIPAPRAATADQPVDDHPPTSPGSEPTDHRSGAHQSNDQQSG